MRVELKGICKRFGHIEANRSIDLKVPAGTIQGILGENGAGKSTLMKILSGCLKPDGGEIQLDGKRVDLASPAEAIRRGIGMLHQDPLDFPTLRVIDNFLAGRGGAWFYPLRRSLREFDALQQRFGFCLDPLARLDALSVGERQQLELLRQLELHARVLILDEPTTGISADQKQLLFATLRRLAESGRTIFLVTHKLEDVRVLCHRVAVLRQGNLAGEMSPPFRLESLVELMFGRLLAIPGEPSAAAADIALELQDVGIERGRVRLSGISLRVRSGETIGLAGLEGSGQDLLLRACAGLIPRTRGRLLLAGRDVSRQKYPVLRQSGVAYVPSARLEQGLLPNLNLMEHLALAELPGKALIDWGSARIAAERRIAEFSIQAKPDTPLRALSGGNQQRALLGLLEPRLALLLLEHPTRGLDVESASAIWGKLRRRCGEGTAILFTSADLDELIRHSDRILVFCNGAVSPALSAGGCTPELLGGLIGGRGWGSAGTGASPPC